jgi:hydroxymethylglutaryl-CoA lyase
MNALPAAVSIREVGPRDGFQNEPDTIPTARKIELIDALARTGLPRLEVTSFVRPDVIPQLADAEQVLAAIHAPAGVSLSVLIPNERGLERALAVRERLAGDRGRGGRPAFDEINVFLSASETHNRRNVNRSIEESLVSLEGVLARARAEGLRCEGVISTSFGCPYEGHVPPARVLHIARRLRDAGAQEIGFGDTTGMANPVQVAEFFAHALSSIDGALAEHDALAGHDARTGQGARAGEGGSAGERGGPGDGHIAGKGGDAVQLTAHFHNTRGQGLANALAALQAGVTSFESSFGELGGCPVPAGATGNIATEDLVSMLHEMDIATGIHLEALLACSHRVQEILGRRLGSHTLVAGPIDWR